MSKLGVYRGIVMLLLLFVLVPVATYRFALRQTLRLWLNHDREQEQLYALQSDSLQFPQRESPDPAATTDGRVQPESLFVLIESQGGIVERYTPYTTQHQGEMTLCTSEIVIQGAYIPLVRTIDLIERQMRSYKIVSVDYRLIQKRTAGDKTNQLRLTLLLQSVTNTLKTTEK